MKGLLLFSIFLSSFSFAQERQMTDFRTREFVSESAIVSEEDKNLTLKASFWSGGCGREDHEVKVDLEHVSTTDVTPAWALEEDPNMTHEYRVVMKAVVKERKDRESTCAMAYDLSVEEDLEKKFKEIAPSLGFDLKKSHYSVTFVAPEIRRGTSFLTWDQK